MHTEFFDFLVQRETGWVGRDFEQHAAGFTEVNGMKISAIDYWRHVVAKIDETLAPLELFGLVLRSKRNVMHRTSRDAAGRGVRLTQQVDNSAGRSVVRGCKPKAVSRLVNQTIAERVGE